MRLRCRTHQDSQALGACTREQRVITYTPSSGALVTSSFFSFMGKLSKPTSSIAMVYFRA
jgi:hypothetical protein